MRGFLDLTDNYKKFIQNIGKSAMPLAKMFQKDSFIWACAAKESFQQLGKA